MSKNFFTPGKTPNTIRVYVYPWKVNAPTSRINGWRETVRSCNAIPAGVSLHADRADLHVFHKIECAQKLKELESRLREGGLSDDRRKACEELAALMQGVIEPTKSTSQIGYPIPDSSTASVTIDLPMTSHAAELLYQNLCAGIPGLRYEAVCMGDIPTHADLAPHSGAPIPPEALKPAFERAANWQQKLRRRMPR